MLIHERVPRGDDAGGVAADIKHVGEVNEVRAGAELIAEPRDLLVAATTTRTGSPESIPSAMNDEVWSTKSSPPTYSNAS